MHGFCCHAIMAQEPCQTVLPLVSAPAGSVWHGWNPRLGASDRPDTDGKPGLLILWAHAEDVLPSDVIILPSENKVGTGIRNDSYLEAQVWSVDCRQLAL